MENKIKIVLFVCFVGYMIVGLIVKIPPFINNIIYGTMAIFALFFLFTNKENLGLNDMFKKDDKKEEEDNH